eukprot:GHVU01227771.1.p4 GENE.GHVU01227771.1~~GHVU01227771.1.p4  ORF type:complete len:103 (-),score=4.77 GHVU01227771.1:341-649(-)
MYYCGTGVASVAKTIERGSLRKRRTQPASSHRVTHHCVGRPLCMIHQFMRRNCSVGGADVQPPHLAEHNGETPHLVHEDVLSRRQSLKHCGRDEPETTETVL